MSYFSEMGWGQAVDYVRTVAFVADLLVLSVPVGAFIAIVHGRRTRPGEKLIFPRIVLWTCLALLIGLIAYFFSGRWYGENGPPPQEMAARVTVHLFVILGVVAAIHVGLYWSTLPRRPR